MSDRDRYEKAMQAMQAGVAAERELGSKDAEPKHLRVGVNSALCENTALLRLLIGKGIITIEEYWKELADEVEREVGRYEARLTAQTGKKIVLH